MTMPAFLHENADGVMLAVKVQPRAARNEINGPLGNELRIRVTAPPVDAAANAALIELLAERLGCPRGRIELVRGHNSRHKIINIHGCTAAEILARLTSEE